MLCFQLTNFTFKSKSSNLFTFKLPSPLALCLSLCPIPAAALSLCPLVSSAPLLSSTRFARSVALVVTAVQRVAVRRSPAAALCCGGSHFPTRAFKPSQLQVFVFAVTNGCLGSTSVKLSAVLRVSHLDEHGAGLGGDGWQLLQDTLGNAQALFQTLVLCWQTKHSLLWVCGPLRKYNIRLSSSISRKRCKTKMLQTVSIRTCRWACVHHGFITKNNCLAFYSVGVDMKSDTDLMNHYKSVVRSAYSGSSQSWQLLLTLFYATL